MGDCFRGYHRGQRPGAAFTGRTYDRTVVPCSTRERSCSPGRSTYESEPLLDADRESQSNADRDPCQPRRARVDQWELLQHTRPYAAHCRGAAIARCNPILDQGAIVAVHPVLEKAAGELASRPSIDRRSTGPGRDLAYPKPSSIGPAITCQAGRWGFTKVSQTASPIGRPAITMHAQPAATDNVRKGLVALKMPRALRMLDTTCGELKEGEVTWIEALDHAYRGADGARQSPCQHRAENVSPDHRQNPRWLRLRIPALARSQSHSGACRIEIHLLATPARAISRRHSRSRP